jgi:hypothetical protein
VQASERVAGQSARPHLVVLPSAIAARQGEYLYLDKKAVSGANEYVKNWPGKVTFIFREGFARDIVFGSFLLKL